VKYATKPRRPAEPASGPCGALPGNRRENGRPRPCDCGETPETSRHLQPAFTCSRPSNQCINWVVPRWPDLLVEQSTR